ncbi:MAG: hypothetical protein RLZZ444_3984 [Pseudomonadota bacterium]
MSTRRFSSVTHAQGWLKACNRAARHVFARLKGDRTGAAAIEFAIIAPILIGIYISAYEVTAGYSTARNVLKAAGTVADVVTRQPTVSKTFLSQMFDAAEATIAPHSATGMTMKVSGITIDSAGNARVLWSWNQDGGVPYSAGSTAPVPDDMQAPSSFLVRAEISLPHTMLLFLGSESETRSVTIRREFYYRQRLGAEILCTDCS